MKTNYNFVEEDSVYSPQLVYYPELIQNNIDLMIKIAKDPKRLWPHIKTYKIAEVIKMLLASGIDKVKCATIAEVELALVTGVKTVFMAYPLVGPNIERFIKLCKHYSQSVIYACGDDTKQIEQLAFKAKENGIVINLLMDVDTGLHRTGVAIDLVEDFYETWSKFENIKMCGLHCYDGHRHEADEKLRYDFTKTSDLEVTKIKESLQNKGYDCSIMIMGGTPSFPCHEHFTDYYLSPGTCIIQDSGYQANYHDLPFVPAAAILTRVISRPTENTFTIDLGTKAIASDPPIRCKIAGMEYLKTIMHNEEHMVFEVDEQHLKDIPEIGTILYAIPTHVCPTSVLYPSVKVVKQNHLVDEWKIAARDRQINF